MKVVESVKVELSDLVRFQIVLFMFQIGKMTDFFLQFNNFLQKESFQGNLKCHLIEFRYCKDSIIKIQVVKK